MLLSMVHFMILISRVMLWGGPDRAQVQRQGEITDAAAITNILIIADVEI